MALAESGVKLVLDGLSPFVSGMTSANTAMSGLASVATTAATGVEGFSKATQDALKISALSDKINQQKSSLSILEQSLTLAQGKYASLGSAVTAAQAKYAAAGAALEKLTSDENADASAVQKAQAEYAKAGAAVHSAEQAYAAAGVAVQKQDLALNTLTSAIQKDETALVRLETTVQGEGKAMQSAVTPATALATAEQHVGQAAGEATPKINAMAEMTTGALRQVGTLAVNALQQAATGILSFGKDTLDIATTYESALHRFSAVTGQELTKSGKTVDDYSAKFLQLGRDTKFSALEAANAAIALSKGGMDLASISADGLSATLNLASAGELDLSKAAEITSKQFAIWRDSGISATKVTDLLAEAANSSTTTVEELNLGLANVGGTAKLTGLTFHETVQGLAELAPGFASTADAGTSFKAFLIGLNPVGKKQIEMMEELGLSTGKGKSAFYDASGAFIGMDAASKLLQGSLKGMSEEQTEMALKVIFGTDGIRAASLVAKGGAPAYELMGQKMTDMGTAAKMADDRNQGMAFSMKQLTGSIQTVQIIIGSMFLPVLSQMIDGFTSIVNVALVFAQGGKGIEGAIEAMATAVNKVVPGLGSFVATILRAATTAPTLTTGLNAVAPGLGSFVGGVQQAITAVQPFVTMLKDHAVPILTAVAAVITTGVIVAVASMAAPFLAVAAPIAALAAVAAALMVAFTTNFGGVKDVVESVMGAVGKVIGEVMTIFNEAFGTELGKGAGEGEGAFKQFEGVVTAVLSVVKDVVVGGLGLVADFMHAHGKDIAAVIKDAWTIISTVVSTVMGVIQGVMHTVTALMRGDWEGVWNGLVEIVRSAFGGIGSIISSAMDMVARTVRLQLDAIKMEFMNLYNSLVHHSIVPDMMSEIAGAWSGLKDITGVTTKALVKDTLSAFGSLSTTVTARMQAPAQAAGRVAPPATPGQIQNSSVSNTNSTSMNLYQTVTPTQATQSAQSFAALRAFALT